MIACHRHYRRVQYIIQDSKNSSRRQKTLKVRQIACMPNLNTRQPLLVPWTVMRQTNGDKIKVKPAKAMKFPSSTCNLCLRSSVIGQTRSMQECDDQYLSPTQAVKQSIGNTT